MRRIICICFLFLYYVAVPGTSLAAQNTHGETRAILFHESSFTLIERVMFHIGERTKARQSHQAGGNVNAQYLDNGNEVVKFDQFHRRNGLWENYRLHGVFLIPAKDEFTLVNQFPVILTFIYPDKELTYEIREFKVTVRDSSTADQDFELLSYSLVYKSPTAGLVSTRTTEPLRYRFNSVFYTLSSAKPLAGKIEIISKGKKAMISVLPTPENHTYQQVQVDVDGRTYKEDLRYLDQSHFPELPAGM